MQRTGHILNTLYIISIHQHCKNVQKCKFLHYSLFEVCFFESIDTQCDSCESCRKCMKTLSCQNRLIDPAMFSSRFLFGSHTTTANVILGLVSISITTSISNCKQCGLCLSAVHIIRAMRSFQALYLYMKKCLKNVEFFLPGYVLFLAYH